MNQSEQEGSPVRSRETVPPDVVMPTEEEIAELEAGRPIDANDQPGQGDAGKGSIVRRVGGSLLGWAVGWSAAEYFRVRLILIPGIAFFVSFAFLHRVLRDERRPFVFAIAFQLSHLAWFSIGAVVTRQYYVVIDVILVVFGIALVLWRPGWRTAIFLAVYNFGLMVMNMIQLGTGLSPEVPDKALQLHILIRFAFLVSLAYAVRFKKPISGNEAPEGATGYTVDGSCE